MSDTTDAKTKVFYDGSCPLCVAEISHYAKRDLDGALELVDVSRADAQLPADLNASQAMARFHVQDSSGAVKSGAAGFTSLWAEVPGWRWLAKVARFPGVIYVLEGLYRLFLIARPLIVRSFVVVTRARKRATRGRP